MPFFLSELYKDMLEEEQAQIRAQNIAKWQMSLLSLLVGRYRLTTDVSSLLCALSL